MSDEETAFTFSVALGDSAARLRQPTPRRAELHVAIAAELLPREEFSLAGPRSLEPIALSVGDPDAVVRELCPTFRIEVPDPFGGPRPLAIDLRWDGLKALRPNEIVAAVPVLGALVRAKTIMERQGARAETSLQSELEAVLGRADWVHAVLGAAGSEVEREADPRDEIRREPAPPAATRGARSSLDALLDRVELPSSSTGAQVSAPDERRAEGSADRPRADRPLAAIVAAVARSATAGSSSPTASSRTSQEAPRTPRARLEAAFTRTLRAVYRHPEVRRLERSYRGIELISRRLARGAPVRVSVVPLAERHGPETLAAWARRLPPDETPDLIAVDARIDASEAELARLEAWASLGAELHALVLLEAQPGLFGATSLEEALRVSRIWSSPDESETLPLRRAAARESARWLVLGVGGLLGRAPYTPENARLRDLPFEESDGSPESWLVVSPVFGLALLPIQSMIRVGHPFFVTGAENAIRDLPLRSISEHGDVAAVPLEARFGSDTRRELSRAGLSVFACKLNSDAAFVERATVLYRGADVVRGAKNPAAIPVSDQLAIGRLSRALRSALRSLPERSTGSSVREAVVTSVSEIFPNPPPVGPELTVELSQSGGVQLRVQPHRYAGLSFEEVELSSSRSA